MGQFRFRAIIFFCILLSISVKSYATIDSTEVSAERMADLIIEEAKKHIGARYSYGSSNANSFDCSGFTSYVYKKFGYTLSRSSKGQAHDGRSIEGDLSNLQKGDLVIFGSRGKSKSIGHVGIFIALDSTGTDFSFIHAAVHGGVTISKMKEPYYNGRFLGARRIIADFLPTDSTKKEYSFDIEKTVSSIDTLKLKSNEYRIILLEDGKWAYVSDEGAITEPEGNDKIVLDQHNSTWSIIKTSTKMVPSLSTTKTATTTTTTATNGEAIYHTMKSGDCLYTIAKRYNTSIKAICALNAITEKTVLKIGRKLRVK